MQDLQVVLDSVMLVAFLALYGTVTWSLIRYSTREIYRYWAIGWVVYSIGAIIGAAISTSALALTDFVAYSSMYFGATLIQDGTRQKKLNRRRITIYISGVFLIFIVLILGLYFSWPFNLILAPLGFHIAYVCFSSAKTVLDMNEPLELPTIGLIIGFILWGASWIGFPIMATIPEYYLGFMLMQAGGVVLAGSSMLTLFMMTVTRDLEQQNRITRIMSGLVQHDIRNFIQVARLALELTENTGIVNNHWIEVASDSLDGAKTFVDEMRDVAVSFSQAKIKPEPIQLTELIDSVRNRVISEYELEPEQVRVMVSEETEIITCKLSKELLWNIFDNAFKHGSTILNVQERVMGNPGIILEISDQGGGMSSEIKGYLNDNGLLSEDVPAGVGLGVILIKGLASMCRTKLHVQDIVKNNIVIGTKYSLSFKLSK